MGRWLVWGCALGALAMGCGDEEGGASGSASGGGGNSGSGGNVASGGAAGWEEAQGKPCPAAGCPAPLSCVSYCGFAGCDRGSFSSCEIECNPQADDCPAGQICVSVADGPGDVCMPE
jgi:hypothetical protein